VANQRKVIALVFLGLAVIALMSTRAALAEKMIFLAAGSPDKLEVNTSFQAEQGTLILDPTGSTVDALKVEIVTPQTGRSPASSSESPVVKKLILKGIASYHLVAAASGKIIQIRILAP
jgi:hypothetical protein